MCQADNRLPLISGKRLFCCISLVTTAVVAAGLAITGVNKQTSRGREYPPLSADLQAASDANGQFAIDLYRQLVETKPGENLFISPFAISPVLAMVAEGAVGQTRAQMLDVLHISKEGLEEIHRGQAGLQHAAVPPVPPGFTEKLASLRAKFQEADDRTKAFYDVNPSDEALASERIRDNLKNEIKSLVSQISACELQTANALWLERSYPVQPGFLSTATSKYGMVVRPIDFKRSPDPARLQINAWIAEQTNNRISDLLPPETITDLMRLVITNTVYFKGDWAQPFMAYDTRLHPFHLQNERSVQLQMMYQENPATASYGAFTAAGNLFATPREVRFEMKHNDPSLYPDAKGHTMLALDYKAHKIQMILLVPQSATGIADLEQSLAYETLQRWIALLESRSVYVMIPKFKFESKIHLATSLKSMGMLRAFENPEANPQGAQFDKLTSAPRPKDRIYISDVVHQTSVDVSELGTEAAAATATSFPIGDDSDDLPKIRPFIPFFIADKPFLFLIRDRETASILFLGRYISPNLYSAEG